MTDFSKTLIRCSAISRIMSQGKNRITEKQLLEIEEYQKKEKLTSRQEGLLADLIEKRDRRYDLSEGTKTFLEEQYALDVYKKQPDITTKEMAKGILVEPDSIELLSYIEGRNYEKNHKRVKNSFIQGTPDLYDGPTLLESEEIIDIKSNWNMKTFLRKIKRPLPVNYYWQLQGYMALTGAKYGTLAYCLVDAPETYINDQKRSLFHKMECVTDEDPNYLEAAEKLEFSLRFSEINPELRVLRVTIDRNDEDISAIYDRVVKCREYLSEFEQTHIKFCKEHRRKVYEISKEESADAAENE
jgi:hypothetical protein